MDDGPKVPVGYAAAASEPLHSHPDHLGVGIDDPNILIEPGSLTHIQAKAQE